LFQFVINPTSFGQSVENLFYLSFLGIYSSPLTISIVKEGKVEIDIDDETGETFVAVLSNEDADDEEGESTTTQLILTIDQPLWRVYFHLNESIKEAIELYDLKTCYIPNREPKISSGVEKGWY
jgi:TfoX/Sxy family transcriptional regulator of competence genes